VERDDGGHAVDGELVRAPRERSNAWVRVVPVKLSLAIRESNEPQMVSPFS
jgi:hypothetical protein